MPIHVNRLNKSKPQHVSLVVSSVFIGVIGIISSRFLFASPTSTYYVNCISGNDSNSGSSTSAAWRTVSTLVSKSLAAGDTVKLARGCTWDSTFTIPQSGTTAKPILFTSYGSGALPTLLNSTAGSSGNGWTAAVQLTGNYIILDGVIIRDTGGSGIRIQPGATHNIIRNSEIYNTGFGVEINGNANLITHNYVHNLHMIVNTPTNVNNNDDFGAVGFNINGTDNEVSYNTCIDCIAPSYDYGSDGGFVEIWNSGDNTYVHHNHALRTGGFFELGAPSPTQHANNVRVEYNVAEEVGGCVLNINSNNVYTISVTNFRLEHNTFITPDDGYQSIIYDATTPTALIVKSNIFYITGGTKGVWWNANGNNYAHTNNLYYLGNGATVGYTLGTSEVLANPNFVNPANKDYHLTANSPARGIAVAGLAMLDLDNKLIGAPYDAGAYQYQGYVDPTSTKIKIEAETSQPVGDGVTTPDSSASAGNTVEFGY